MLHVLKAEVFKNVFLGSLLVHEHSIFMNELNNLWHPILTSSERKASL